MRRKSSEYARELYSQYAGGLIVVILVILQALLGLSSLDHWAFLSILAFALSLPCLSGVLIVNFIEKRYPYGYLFSKSSQFFNILSTVGIVTALAGIDAAFSHISPLLGIAFFIALVSTILICGWYISELHDHL
jgi:hypothetical protein